MPETLQTRTEHSRSLEDAERLRAVHTLTKIGLLTPLAETESFHGRIMRVDDTEEWGVDPTFANGGNDSGNRNLHLRPTLYSGERDVAERFAQTRGQDTVLSEYHKALGEKVRHYTPEERDEWLARLNAQRKDLWDSYSDDVRAAFIKAGKSKAVPLEADYLNTDRAIFDEVLRLEHSLPKEESDQAFKAIANKYRLSVHEITSNDADAVILNKDFQAVSLNDEQMQQYYQALKALVIPISEGSPLGFESREEFAPFAKVLERVGKPYVADEEIEGLAAKAGVSVAAARQIVSAYNARQALAISPVYVADQLVNNASDIIPSKVTMNGGEINISLNLEYVQRFMREAHIVGMKHKVSSATLGGSITSVSFFDLERAFSTHQLEKNRSATWQQLGALARRFDTLPWTDEPMQEPNVLHLLKDVYVKPEKLVEAAKEVEGYSSIFDADAGNWEGFSLAEHTETVLRNFDENFADHWPVELLAPMRLAILAHDVGKPRAAKEGQKRNQKHYNVVQATDFLEKLEVSSELKELVVAMIGDGGELAFQINVASGGQAAEAEMKAYARKTLERIYPDSEVTESQIEAFEEMCKALQICDGAAYTSMAVTRSTTMGRYRNAPSFNASFAEPVGPGKRDIKLRK